MPIGFGLFRLNDAAFRTAVIRWLCCTDAVTLVG